MTSSSQSSHLLPNSILQLREDTAASVDGVDGPYVHQGRFQLDAAAREPGKEADEVEVFVLLQDRGVVGVSTREASREGLIARIRFAVRWKERVHGDLKCRHCRPIQVDSLLHRIWKRHLGGFLGRRALSLPGLVVAEQGAAAQEGCATEE